VVELGDAVESADSANTVIPPQDLFAEIARVAAELPFVHAPIGAESEASRRHFEIAPAAERASIVPGRQLGTIRASTGHFAASAEHLKHFTAKLCLTAAR
jgi:hypothetical protein